MLNRFINYTATMMILLVISIAKAAPTETNLLVQGVLQFRNGEQNWHQPALTNAVALLHTFREEHPESFAAHYWEGVAQFHVLLCRRRMADKERDKDQEGRIMEDAIAVLRQALELTDDGETHALLSTLYGMQISERPHTAVWKGRKVMAQKKLALKGKPASPRTYYLLGMSYFHAAKKRGGKKDALKSLKKAEGLFEAEKAGSSDLLAPAWGYVHCLAFIGETYRALGNWDMAAAYYQKALAINPSHAIAKGGLEQCQKRKKRE